MRICVYGAGAVGGHFAAKLAAAGHEVSVVARGAHLAAIERDGLTLRVGERTIVGHVRAAERPDALGRQDVVIATMKQPALPSLADGIAPLLDDDTAVVFAQNGMPWWYGLGLSPTRPQPPDLSRLDPGGKLARAIAMAHIVGGVIHSSNEVVAPGVISNDFPHRATLVVGEADDRPSERIAALRRTLAAAGIDSPPTSDIRKAVWQKLIINMSVSLLSVLTGQKSSSIAEDDGLGAIFHRAFAEAVAVAAAHGIDFTDDRLDPETIRKRLPRHLPSIRQDYERGRPMEVEAIVRAPLLFARAAGVATPSFDVVAAIVTRLATDKGLYRT